jgi:opacity protein-like surface antigen
MLHAREIKMLINKLSLSWFRIQDHVWKYAFLFSTVLSSDKIAAQTAETSFKRFGFQAGINISNMNFNIGDPAPAIKTNASWQTGFTFGFQLKVPLTKKLLIQPEYSYSQRNGSNQTVETTYTINYFSLPILLNYQLSPRFNILAGPQFEVTTNASSSTNGENSNITHDVEERGFGIVGGLEFTVIKSFFLSARYLDGLNHVGIGQRSEVKEFKYESFILTAGVRF